MSRLSAIAGAAALWLVACTTQPQPTSKSTVAAASASSATIATSTPVAKADECAGLPVPSDARIVFCAKQTAQEAWMAALTPLKRPDKANAELVVMHRRNGEQSIRRRSVLARDSWRRDAWTYDFDGDGHDELVLSVDGPHDELLTYRAGKIEPYPQPHHPIERFEDVDGDGRLDPIFRVSAPLAHDCHGSSVDLSSLQAGIAERSGRFVMDHQVIRDRLRKDCPAPPSGSLLGAAAAGNLTGRIRCARLWGMSREEAIRTVLRDCRPHRAQARTCQGPCRNLDVLLAAASNDPPVRLAPERPSRAAAPAPGASGKLPPEVIQRIVRRSMDRLRSCYQATLRNSPNLQGRVAVRFVIGTDGTVTSAQDAGSDVPNGEAIACVVRRFYQLSFPKPEGGAVTVSYPVVFTPGG